MKICLIGPGYIHIPPPGWGAIESIIWDYYVNLKKLDVNVEIINNANLHEVIVHINKSDYDIVHIMYDDHITIVPRIQIECKILYTSHYPYITHPSFETQYQYYYRNVFKNVIANKERVIICAISQQIKDKYVSYGYPENKIYVIHNGARDDKFEYIEQPSNANKSIYLARIENRKRQYVYQSIPNIDFVGNYRNLSFKNSVFDRSNSNYLGEWKRDMLYKNLSSYGNLVLLSEGEADPLSVKEALICGLGIVVSECSTGNIDTNLSFVDVVPNNQLNNIEYVTNIINKNREISIKNRDEIRKYGLETFSWKNIIHRYKQLLESL